ncbi:MAG: hypothetical protein U1F25_13700 [Rubrivivax sp.]
MNITAAPESLSPKAPGETVFTGVDFKRLTATPSAPVVTATRFAGAADPTPEAIISGAASVNGSIVVQKIVGGVSGCTYMLRFQCSAPDGSVFVEHRTMTVLDPR